MTEPKRQNELSLLNPSTEIKMKAFKRFCREQGMMIQEFETMRTLERQKYLYSVGRTIRTDERPITWTMQSKHLDGKATDRVFLVDGDPKKPSWQGDWGKFVRFSKYFGLDSLAPTEQCHLQDNGKTLRETMEANGSFWNITKSADERRFLRRANDIIRGLIK